MPLRAGRGAKGGQTRSYYYDMLGRLTQASAPESGTTYFYYTTSGGSLCSGDPRAVCRRTDARGTTTTYAYDALSRLTQKTYSDGTPEANFFYDQPPGSWPAWSGVSFSNAKGRLVLACANSASGTCASPQTAVAVSYDKMGRTQDLWQCTPDNCGNSSIWDSHYNYDLGGDVTSWTHPAGFTITNTVNGAQQVTQIASSWSDSSHPPTLAQNVAYTPFGALSSLQNGCVGSGCVQTQETYGYNNRLEVTGVELGTSGSPSANYNLTYNYNLPGGQTPPGCPVAAQGNGNNGDVIGYTYSDSVNPGLSHSALFVYDSVDRLACAQATGNSTYNLTFGYNNDGSGRYGNMSCVQNAQTNGPCPQWTLSASTNQITTSGFSYDAAGNMTADGVHTYQWDAEGRLASVDNGSTDVFTYNALGQRAERYVPANSQQTRNIEYQYDSAGQEIGAAMPGYFGQYDAMLMLPGGSRVYYFYSSNNTWFYHVNGLGSTGQVTDNAGAVPEDFLYYPWGQPWVKLGQDYWAERFAGQGEPMPENGLNPTDFRAFSPTQGRWLSPDPAGLAATNPTNPQSWNRYAYVVNNPLAFTDPLGLYEWGSCYEDQNEQWVCPPIMGGGGGTGTGCGPASLVRPAFGGAAHAEFQNCGTPAGGGGGGIAELPISVPGHTLQQLLALVNPNPCGTTGFGFGLTVGGNLDAGVFQSGSSATGTFGFGLFHNSQSGTSVGGFATEGLMTTASDFASGTPWQDPGNSVAGGAFAGLGAGVFFTNAGSRQQLGGAFQTLNFNVGLSYGQLQIQFAKSGGVWYLQVSPPYAGMGAGLSVTAMNTNTTTTNPSCQ